MFSTLKALFAKNKIGSLALNVKMDPAQAHGSIEVDHPVYAGAFTTIPFKVEKPEGLKLWVNKWGCNHGSVVRSICKELHRMGYDNQKLLRVSINTAEGPMLLDARPSFHNPQFV